MGVAVATTGYDCYLPTVSTLPSAANNHIPMSDSVSHAHFTKCSLTVAHKIATSITQRSANCYVLMHKITLLLTEQGGSGERGRSGERGGERAWEERLLGDVGFDEGPDVAGEAEDGSGGVELGTVGGHVGLVGGSGLLNTSGDSQLAALEELLTGNLRRSNRMLDEVALTLKVSNTLTRRSAGMDYLAVAADLAADAFDRIGELGGGLMLCANHNRPPCIPLIGGKIRLRRGYGGLRLIGYGDRIFRTIRLSQRASTAVAIDGSRAKERERDGRPLAVAG